MLKRLRSLLIGRTYSMDSLDTTDQISVETVRKLAKQSGLTLDLLARMLRISRRAVAAWLGGQEPSRSNKVRLIEFGRMYQALSELVEPSAIGPWLEKSNLSLEGSTPLQVIERGESDRIWRIVWQLREGNVGD
jgi:transcriptional regulator with XRE-family HTH domain